MFKFKIEGINSFHEAIKDIKLNDKIILKRNINNQLSEEAIGVYNIFNKKLGYAPFKYSQQINLNLNYFIYNINLSTRNIIIGCIYPETNYIDIIKPDNSNSNININHDLYSLKKKLEISGLKITDIKLLYADDYFIDINIKSEPNIDINFYTVTKKYYDNNLIKYNEFFENNLIEFNVYRSFYTHRLEQYIIKKYKLLNDIGNNIENKLYYNHKRKVYWYDN
jgi:hypothetical protein